MGRTGGGSRAVHAHHHRRAGHTGLVFDDEGRGGAGADGLPTGWRVERAALLAREHHLPAQRHGLTALWSAGRGSEGQAIGGGVSGRGDRACVLRGRGRVGQADRAAVAEVADLRPHEGSVLGTGACVGTQGFAVRPGPGVGRRLTAIRAGQRGVDPPAGSVEHAAATVCGGSSLGNCAVETPARTGTAPQQTH